MMTFFGIILIALVAYTIVGLFTGESVAYFIASMMAVPIFFYLVGVAGSNSQTPEASTYKSKMKITAKPCHS